MSLELGSTNVSHNYLLITH